MDSLTKIWEVIVLLHNTEFKDSVLKCLIDRVRLNISHDGAVVLEYDFKKFPKDYRDDVSEVFRDHALFLLESPKKWKKKDITAIKRLLHDNSMNWSGKEIIQSLELISQSHTLELLNIFPELLDNWFRSDCFDTKEEKIPKICMTWFKNLLSRLDINESDFVFLIFHIHCQTF